jgi:hypothetical protein
MMSTQIELANKRLFGANGIGAKNIKFFPGTSRDITAEQLATELNKALSQIEAGAYDYSASDED